VMKRGEQFWAEWPLSAPEVTVHLDDTSFQASRQEFDLSVMPTTLKWPKDG
jgi:hypothetical protein